MAEFSVHIPDDQVDRVVDTLCEVGGYVPGEDDSQKVRRDFAKSVVVRYIRTTVLQHEHRRAMAEAMSSVTVDPVPID
jgi:hypothetical protein